MQQEVLNLFRALFNREIRRVFLPLFSLQEATDRDFRVQNQKSILLFQLRKLYFTMGK